MDFSTFSKYSLITYKKYFEMLLMKKENQNLKTFLEQCKEELNKRK